MAERTCSINGCDSTARTRGWCNAHYLKWYRKGDPEYRPVARQHTPCSVEGCERPARGRGWCNTHYLRWLSKSDLGHAAIRKYNSTRLACSFEGCENKSSTAGLCGGHSRQRARGQELRPLKKKTDPTNRDAAGRKLCGTCNTWLQVDSFTRSGSRSDGLSARCGRCERSQSLKRKFGITLDQYERLLAQQAGGCAVCRKGERANGRRLAVDHDHTCCPGQVTCGRCVRGLLCSSCNLHFGAIGDSLAHIEAMASYLRGFQAGR
jgi:hypothetical protein